MERYFNTEGLCVPEEHYMVRLDDRLEKIKRLFVDRGKYFIINRGRQYGKTTTLRALAEYLRDDYLVVSMDFQMMSTASFENENKFVNAFVRYFVKSVKEKENTSVWKELMVLETGGPFDMDEMFVQLGKICEVSTKPIVMMIDEVDSASNNQVFLDFLALLRGYYLKRENKSIFQSVILAGVYDIKNLKLKIRPEGEHKYNSPWNIAAKFNLDMSFSTDQIARMLWEYEEDNKTGMDIHAIAKCVYEYTSGYPYLVSAICKLLDEEISESNDFKDMASVWTEEGIAEAVKILLKENTPLFDSMVKQLNIYKDLRNMIEEILYQGKEVFYSPDVESINIGMMFGLLKEKNNHVVISNRIFEMRLLNMFIAEEAVKSEAYRYGQRDKNQFIQDSRLNMDLVLEKFVEYFTELYGENDERFVEAYGRKFFLLYLKPIINGVGNYYMEAQTRDAKRTDVIVDYLGEQFVVELKIWRGNEYNERGEEQLIGYLDYFHQKKGYMLSFNFNKRKEVGVKVIEVGDKVIVEAVV
ncbi:MAG: 9-O-acetyl-N-acetylneuraminate esterase [Hungatella sp.]|nr:9-O-acetyl-N-acetylneuraminate esterase [Hungatella sp.]